MCRWCHSTSPLSRAALRSPRARILLCPHQQSTIGHTRAILAGDHKQLPPTVLNRTAAKEGLDRSLFERLFKAELSLLLDTQYRMNDEIMAFPNREFYEGRIRSGSHNARRTLASLRRFQGEVRQPVIWIDTAGSAVERQRQGSQSRENPGELKLVLALYDTLLIMTPH